MLTEISFISCSRSNEGRWQVHVRGEGRGWTTAQKDFSHPVPALLHALEQYAGVDDAREWLNRMDAPPLSRNITEDLF